MMSTTFWNSAREIPCRQIFFCSIERWRHGLVTHGHSPRDFTVLF